VSKQNSEDEGLGSFGEEKTDGIVGGRGDGQFDDEMAADPEAVVFRASANKWYVLMEPILAVFVGAVLGAGIWYLLRTHVFTYSYFKYDLILKASFLAPPILLLLASLKKLYPKLAKRFEISRRFIRSNLFAGIDLVETTDMNKVQDLSMTRLGPVVNIKIMTRDKTTPEIRMEYIDRAKGEAIFAFISAHSMESLVEMRASGTRRKRAPKVSP
jgi:hypothetical protein